MVAQKVKNLPAMQETWVRSLGQEDPLERGGHVSTLQYSCREILWIEGAWWATVPGRVAKESDMTW